MVEIIKKEPITPDSEDWVNHDVRSSKSNNKRSKTGRVLGAITLAVGLPMAAASVIKSSPQAISEHVVHTGEVVPTGDTITTYDGHPGEWVVHGSNHNWGQTEAGQPSYIAGISNETNNGTVPMPLPNSVPTFKPPTGNEIPTPLQSPPNTVTL